MKQKSFISNNEERANIITTRILLISILAFPALIILGLIKVFDFDMLKLYNKLLSNNRRSCQCQ